MSNLAAATSGKKSSRAGSHGRSYGNGPWYILSTVVIFLILFFYGRQEEGTSKAMAESSSRESEIHKQESNVMTTGSTAASAIVTGSIRGVDYYHCPAAPEVVRSSSSTRKKDLVLLHGAAFSKETWKETGILQKFCDRSDLSVTAFDLNVRSSQTDLEGLLRAMSETTAPLVQSLPVTALVTPSASGAAVVEWIEGEYEKSINSRFGNYVRCWIPVAAGSVNGLPDAALQALRQSTIETGKLDILSIYGDQDLTAGKKTSDKLRDVAGASVRELPGRHPVYLDSPNEFVTTVLDKLDSLH